MLLLQNVINKPFKVGRDRNDDDVSLFLLYEFAVHARLADADLASEEVVEIAEHLERIEDNEEVRPRATKWQPVGGTKRKRAG